jgi:hypothetical protein
MKDSLLSLTCGRISLLFQCLEFLAPSRTISTGVRLRPLLPSAILQFKSLLLPTPVRRLQLATRSPPMAAASKTVKQGLLLVPRRLLLAVHKPNRLIYKRTDANCSSFHQRVFLVLLNPHRQRQTSILSIPRDNLRKQK